eukprot:CAMPEP_0183305240 /NCGR_PEP_ID=MMETSP0160_2-20130417/10051_1 /TAXON_ID=2839 ORGANISM="Odontella Sinensis, Strain Grunow 1884" /NCGR_SAMPLE_ID=MMETSP0160_2 /ASSEMBLY_ACC=CAM_ASM_000250 /LENGTH=41 /DNA_ID= /DNA_START= /DNA_END= /DNA_ORIENTATION=
MGVGGSLRMVKHHLQLSEATQFEVHDGGIEGSLAAFLVGWV